MRNKVHLHGRLGRLFGKVHEFEVTRAAEVFRALHVNFPTQFIEELKVGSYRVIRGRRHGGFDMSVEDLSTLNMGHAGLHIIPVVEGSRSGGSAKGGAMKAILGVAIIGAAIFFSGGTLAAPLASLGTAIPGLGGIATYGTIAGFGLAMSIAGVASMLSPTQKPQNQDQKSDESYSFAGPLNPNEQGTAVPLIYGECIVGSQPISVSTDVADLAFGV